MKTLLITILIFVAFAGYSQEEIEIRSRCNAISLSWWNNTTKEWGEWGEWVSIKHSKLCILKGQRLTIYTDPIQTFDMYTGVESKEFTGGVSYTWYAVNQDGVKCQIKVKVKLNADIQVFTVIDKMRVVYNCTTIIE